MTHNDLTIIYYTANMNKPKFMANTQRILLEAVGDTPIVSVSFKPTVLGNNCTNIVVGDVPRNNWQLYNQVLLGCREAKTDYVAMAEDDMLYSPEHFNYRPSDMKTLAYDVNKWSIFSWVTPPFFSFRVRRLMNSLIAPRKALLANLEERFEKYPTRDSISDFHYTYWGEPGRFEGHLHLKAIKTEQYMAEQPNIMFSTSEALGYLGLGHRKAHNKDNRSKRIDPWGTAEEVLSLYTE